MKKENIIASYLLASTAIEMIAIKNLTESMPITKEPILWADSNRDGKLDAIVKNIL